MIPQGALKRGPNGYPVAGLQLVVTSLERDKDTTVGSIRACASTFVDHMLRADTHIMLEPMMRVELDVPTQFMGEVLSDLTVKRRARVLEVTAQDNIGRTIVDAQVPFATMLGYSTVIRSTTQGEGSFSMEYEEHSVVDKSMLSL